MKLALKIPPGIVTLIIVAVMWWIDLYLNLSWLTFGSSVLVGGIFLGMGAVLGLLGLIQFYRNSTSVDPHQPSKASSLVTNGIYGISRNPMYVGLLLILIGYGFHLGNMLTLVMPLLFVVYMNRYQIMPEEKILAEKFGDKYLKYKTQVRRWL